MRDESYLSRKQSRKHKEKVERTEFERALKEWLQETRTANYILVIIAMLLTGIFLRLLFE